MRTPSNSRSLQDSAYGRRRGMRNLEGRAGQIDQMHVESNSVDPSARLAERRSHAKQEQRANRRSLGITALILLVIALLLAFGLGNCAVRGSVSGAMAIDDEDVKSALTAQGEEDPAYYVLVTCLVDDRKSGTNPMEGELNMANALADSAMLVRVEPDAKKISALNIPTNMSVNAEGVSGRHMLRTLPQVGGEASFVRAVSDFVGVPITHYLRTDEQGLASMIDAAGGVRVNVTEAVDDPDFSSVVLDVGEQDLDGMQAVTYAHSDNFADQENTRATHQLQLLEVMFNAAHNRSGFGYMQFADEISKDIKTDMDIQALEDMCNAFCENETYYTAVVPGSEVISDGVVYFTPNGINWPTMQRHYTEGNEPTIKVDTSGIDKAKLDLIVLNGSGVTGLANEVTAKLEAAGYTVAETGNADAYVYDETLVVYRSEDDKLAAEAIVQDLGMGRAVPASVYYNLHSDLQVVVGKDWKPQE